MTTNEQASTIGPTIDEVVAQIEQERVVTDYVEVQRKRVEAAMGLAAAVAFQETIAALSREQASMVLGGMPGEPLLAALAAATEEGRRLLTLLGLNPSGAAASSDGGTS